MAYPSNSWLRNHADHDSRRGRGVKRLQAAVVASRDSLGPRRASAAHFGLRSILIATS